MDFGAHEFIVSTVGFDKELLEIIFRIKKTKIKDRTTRIVYN